MMASKWGNKSKEDSESDLDFGDDDDDRTESK